MTLPPSPVVMLPFGSQVRVWAPPPEGVRVIGACTAKVVLPYRNRDRIAASRALRVNVHEEPPTGGCEESSMSSRTFIFSPVFSTRTSPSASIRSSR